MEFPDVCPSCERSTNKGSYAWFEWEFMTKDPFDRICKCSECGALFRARWKLDSFKQLKEE